MRVANYQVIFYGPADCELFRIKVLAKDQYYALAHAAKSLPVEVRPAVQRWDIQPFGEVSA